MYPVHATRAWKVKRPCGLMDKALVFGTKDCRFESCQGHFCEDEHVRRTYVSMSDAYSVCIWCGLVCSCSCALFRHVGVCSLQQTHTASMNPTRSTKRRRQRRESNPLRAEPNEFPIRHLNYLVTLSPRYRAPAKWGGGRALHHHAFDTIPAIGHRFGARLLQTTTWAVSLVACAPCLKADP